MPYIGTQPKDVRSFGKVQFDFTATQGQTAFTGADDDGKTLGFTEGQIQVYVNGILMDASDYTTSNTNTVTLVSAANLNDIITVVALQTDIPNSDYVPISGGTFTGDVTHTGDVTFSGSIDGNVGIGTSSPQKTLDVRGELAISNSTTSYWNINRDDTDGSLTFTDTNVSERMRIDNAGRVTKPYQPMFTVSQSSTLNYSSDAKVAFNGTVTNIGSHFDLTNDRFTAPVSGRYQFMVQTSISGMSNPGLYCAVYFKRNGSGTGFRFRAYPYNSTSTWSGISGTVQFELNANDYIELWAYSHTGHITLQGTETHFMGHLIG